MDQQSERSSHGWALESSKARKGHEWKQTSAVCPQSKSYNLDHLHITVRWIGGRGRETASIQQPWRQRSGQHQSFGAQNAPRPRQSCLTATTTTGNKHEDRRRIKAENWALALPGDFNHTFIHSVKESKSTQNPTCCVGNMKTVWTLWRSTTVPERSQHLLNLFDSAQFCWLHGSDLLLHLRVFFSQADRSFGWIVSSAEAPNNSCSFSSTFRSFSLCWIFCLVSSISFCLSVLSSSASADIMWSMWSWCPSTEQRLQIVCSHLIMARADVLLELLGGFHQHVALKCWRLTLRLDVSWTEGRISSHFFCTF